MSQAVLESMLPQIEALDAKDLRRLRHIIDIRLCAAEKETATFPPRIVGESPRSLRDRSREWDWLAQHRDEYANQWVALDGDRLVSHGPRLKEVLEAAKAAGVNDALMVQVEPGDAPPFAGSQLHFLD